MSIEAHRYVYLSPQDDCRDALLAAARAAQRSLHLLIYGFTLAELGQVLVDKKAAGLTVGAVVDRTQAAGPAEKGLLQDLVDQGVPITITTSTEHGAIMHNKVLLVDVQELGPDHNDSFVGYGSYNFSASAQEQSNCFITENSAVLCTYFWGQYAQLYQYGLAHCAQLTALPQTTGTAQAPGHPA